MFYRSLGLYRATQSGSGTVSKDELILLYSEFFLVCNVVLWDRDRIDIEQERT